MEMENKRRLSFGLATFLLGALAASAQTTLGPGDDVNHNPGNLSVGAGASVVQSFTGPFSASAPDSEFMGTYSITVYTDPGNVYCAGCYDFVISVQSSGSTDDIQHVTDGPFDPSQVTVGWSAPAGGTACSSTVSTNCYQTPNGVSRTTTGKTVAFAFNGTANLINTQSTPTLIIETSAKTWSKGSLVISDDVGGTFNGFGDLSGVPEPMSLGLIGGGLALVGMVRWRARRKA
jgi:hypothetical protein